VSEVASTDSARTPYIQVPGESRSKVTLDLQPLGMRSCWESYTVASAREYRGRNSQRSWAQFLSGLRMLFEAGQLVAGTRARWLR
jgi:hypothetical protein